MFKYSIKLALIALISAFCLNAQAQELKFATLTPAVTEIMYALGAQNSLIGVSTTCNYPIEAANKEKIGDTYFINKEKIIRLDPDYLIALDTAEVFLTEFKKTNITPIFFKFDTIQDIYKNILIIGELTDNKKKAEKLVSEIKNKISSLKTKNPKKILYIIQSDPMITIGNKSFITDVINTSGHKSITQNLDSYYPIISPEYAIKMNPDIIVVSFYTNIARLKQLFPNAKIVLLTNVQKDILNRPGPRIHMGVQFFSNL